MIFLLILIYTNSILAQDGKFKNIRQVYLWDVTLSMYGFTNDASYKAKKIDRLDMNIAHYDETYDIYNEVQEALIKDIESIRNERTEIVVIPFQDKVCEVWTEFANPVGKRRLVERIRSYTNKNITNTNISGSIKYLQANIFSSNKVDILKLMTDGIDNVAPAELDNVFNSWCEVAKKKDVYGYYIMLTDKASGDIEMKLGDVCRFQAIEGIAVDFVEIIFNEDVFLNIRDDYNKPLKINFSLNDGGELKDAVKVEVESKDNPYVKIKETVVLDESGFVELTPQFLKSQEDLISSLPTEENMQVVLRISQVTNQANSNIVVLRNNECDVNLVNKPEKTFKFNVK